MNHDSLSRYEVLAILDDQLAQPPTRISVEAYENAKFSKTVLDGLLENQRQTLLRDLRTKLVEWPAEAAP